MTQKRYDEIIHKLYTFETQKEKCEYLLSVIEMTDYDENGLNNDLRQLYNQYKEPTLTEKTGN